MVGRVPNPGGLVSDFMLVLAIVFCCFLTLYTSGNILPVFLGTIRGFLLCS